MSVSKEFIIAGDAIFTVELPDGKHYTYRFQKVEANDRWPESIFVKLLTGRDNTSDYTYLGKFDKFTEQVATTAKSKQYDGTLPLRLLNKLLLRIWQNDHDAYEKHGYKTHHEGFCGRCGRLLTTPESVTRGIGPECSKILAKC